MLKITVGNGHELTTLQLEGKLAGPWADVARQAWFEIIATRPASDVTVDLSGLRSIDENGKNLLRKMLKHGSQLRGGGLMMKYIVKRLMQDVKSSTNQRLRLTPRQSLRGSPPARARETPLPI